MKYEILLKRIYEPYEEKDGYRVLVDRLWPRGIKKETAHLDEWAKEITPSTEIRKLYHQGEMPFEGFSQAYTEELDGNKAAEDFVRKCHDLLESQNMTLIYAAKNEQENHAMVLREWLKRQMAFPPAIRHLKSSVAIARYGFLLFLASGHISNNYLLYI